MVFSYDNKTHRTASNATLASQLAVLKDKNVWRYSQYYSIVFGGYVALALWMTKYYVGEYGFSLQTAAFWQRVLVCLVGYCVHWVGGCQISIRHTQSLGGYFGHRFCYYLPYPILKHS